MKRIFFSILVIFIFFTASSFLLPGCAPQEEVVIKYVTEKTGSKDNGSSDEEEVTETEPEPEQLEDEKSEGSEESDEESDLLTFESSFIGGNPGRLIMNIDLETGKVSGTLEMDSFETYLEGTNTKVCEFKITGSLTGEIDPETGIINATMDGEAKSDVASCIGGQIRYDTEAQLYENKKFVTGKFITSTLKYSFVMEKK